MKCKLCGAVHDDDNLYFCITCGAMLKNPMTKEIVTENIEEEIPEVPQVEEISEIPPVTEDLPAIEDVPAVEDISEAEKTPEVSAVVENETESLLKVPVIEENEEFIPPISEKVGEKPVADIRNEKPQQDLYIAREREKSAVNQPISPIPPMQNEAPAPATAPAVPEKTGFGRLFGAFFIALFTGIILIAVSLLFSLKLGFNGDNLKKIIKNTDSWTVVNAEIDGMTVSDKVYTDADFDKATHGNADKTDFALYLAGTDFKGFCADKIKAYADYIIDGKGKEPTITESEMAEFFIANHDRGTEIFGYEMQTADYNSIRTSLTKNEVAEKYSVSKIGWDMKFRLENTKYILSYLTLGILVAVVAVLMIWISGIVKYRGKHVLGYLGNIFTWSGIVVILVAIGASAGCALVHNITGNFLCYLSSTLLLPSALYGGCIGVLLLVTGLIIKKVKGSIKVKEKIRKAVEAK